MTRATSTTLDVMLERRVDDYRNIEGDRTHDSPCWTKNVEKGIHGPGRCSRTNKRHAGPDYLWPEIWKDMSEAAQRKERQKWAIEKPKLHNARRLRGIYFIDPADSEFKDASLKPTNLRESVRKELYTKIMKIILQEKDSIH